MRNASFSRLLAGCMMTAATFLISACSGGGNNTSAISVSISPSATQSLDQGQSLGFTASVSNDSSNAGVTWTVSGGGTLTNSTTTGVTYTAPATVSSVTTAMLTATSVKNTTQTASVSITVHPAPAITTSGALAGGTVGTAYSVTLAATGGSGTLTWTLASGALPAGLSLNRAGVISGTPTTAVAVSFTVKVTDAAATPLSATSSTLTLAVSPAPLTVSAPALGNAVQNKAYTSAAITAAGGTGTIHWTVAGLPAGLALSATTGQSIQITGTPTAAGTSSNIVVTATDSGGAFQQTKSTAALSLTVLTKLSVTTSSLAGGTANTAYTATLQAAGGVTPYTWGATGMPAGLSINATTGVISGTPTTAGTSTPTITVNDSGVPQQQATGQFTITIAPAALAITTTSLPSASVNTAYSQTLQATGGTLPITWSLASGSLPSGLTLNAAGTITGSPIAVGTSTFTVKAADSSSPQQTQTQALSIVVNAAPLAITTTSLPNAEIGTVYSANVTSSGGTGSITWSLVGSLPTGLFLNTATGAITGTPTAAGTVSFSIKATDSGTPQQTQTVNLSIVVYAQLTITTSSLPNGATGSAYSTQLQSTGGSGSVTWSLQAGSSLPAGLTLSNSGLISGTPSVAGTTGFYVQATDSVTTAVAHLGILVNISTLLVPTTSLPNGTQNSSYQGVIQASGGVTPYTITVTSGSLPPGLTFSNCNGGCNGAFKLSGTPTTTGSYSFTVKIADAEATPQTVTESYTVNITAASPLAINSGNTASGEVALPFSFILGASGGTPPYTWSLASASGALPSGLSISSTGQITGSPTTVTGSPFSINVQVNDSASQTATQQMTVTINTARSSANDNELKGQYAALMTGFDSTGNPLATIVAFIADGNGNITGGVFDANGTGLTSPISDTSITSGSYAVGSDGRGKLTLTSSLGTATYVIALDQITSGIADGGYIAEFDLSGQTLTGTLTLQSSSAFTTASIAGGYAVGLSGFNGSATSHTGVIGEIQLNGAGSINSAEFLSSSSGSSTPIVVTSGTYSVASNGRGTLSFSVPNGSGGTNPVDMAFYVVSATKLFMLSLDTASGTNANDLLSGKVLQQTVANGSFTNATLHGISVLHLDGLDSSSGGSPTTYFPDILLALTSFDGAGNISITDDENDGGTVTSNPISATYSVAANGRVTVTGGGGNHPPFFYLVGSNQGFAMNFSGEVQTGYFEPQTATGFSLASLDGTYALGVLAPLSNGSDSTAELSSTGTGSISGTQDQNSQGTLSPDNSLSATYTVGSNGRAVLGGGASGSVIYIISATKALVLDLGSSNPKVQEIQH
ncbi:cadherin repeat domain-containing protein [Granulicella sp. S156]|uniref:beta strand repeat-containing protein n=1 Tax=Granulicella sp. S156 TaxID=1747224 RepID=UPI00131BC01D|nr:cadherin repeat domain-containing protein [Granulicella sp. S156]